MVLGFFGLHRRTCGEDSVLISADGAVLIQECVCGAAKRTPFDSGETDELVELVRAEGRLRAESARR
jgi:hypothetical protein